MQNEINGIFKRFVPGHYLENLYMYIEQLYTNCLAEAAYYIESDGQAAVIDPLRETEPYADLAARRNASIKYVFETHFHADFVSGHIDLAKKAEATIVYGPKADTAYDSYQAKDGEIFSVGKITIQVLHTPGHTPESSCYLLFDEAGRPHALFTGDTLFVGDVGRPDLLDGVMSQEELAGMLYDSLQQKIKALPDDVIVYPAHGPGSACGKNIGKETFSTIGLQKKTNYALQEMSREEFIRKVTDGIPPPPQYFFEDARINKMGYDSIEEVIKKNTKPLSLQDFKKAINAGAVVLDTRKADDFELGFIPGSTNIGLNGQFAVWVGTLIDIESRLVLITEQGKEEESILRLARIGFENIEGFLAGGIRSWEGPLDNVTSITAREMKEQMGKGAVVTDVRKPGEWNVAHVHGAVFLPLSEFPEIFEGLDKSQQYIVHCGGGYRSMTAISIMKKHGFRRLVNVSGGFCSIQNTGIELSSQENVPV
jgi:hydroxyacylglutathione hydrolase